MGKANRFIEDAIYMLKRNFGQPVALYIRGTVGQDPSTGNVTYTESKWKIQRAPVLTAELLRKFQYDLSFIAANKNFTYGGFYDKAQRGIIIDTKDLPKDFVASLDDAFIIDHRRYAIKSVDELEQSRSYIFIVEELKNQRTSEIYDGIDHLAISETVTEQVRKWYTALGIDTLDVSETTSYRFEFPLPNNGIVLLAGRETLATVGNSGCTTRRDYINKYYKTRIRQRNAVITQAKFYVANKLNLTSIKIKIWRKVGTKYNVIGLSENLITQINNGENTVTFTGFTVTENDFVSLEIQSSGLASSATAAKDITVSNAGRHWAEPAPGTVNIDIDGTWTGWTYIIPIYVYTDTPPLIVGVGDSIMSRFGGFIGTSEPTEFDNSILGKLYALDNRLIYQNMGVNSETTTQIQARFTTDCIDLKPRFALIQGGVNDLHTGVSQATYISRMINMLDACVAEHIIPIVCCIMPWTNGTNTEMLTRDVWTLALKTLLTTNYPAALYVDFDTVLGKERVGGTPTPTIGNKWDLQTIYDADGVHQTALGSEVMATEIYRIINNRYSVV